MRETIERARNRVRLRDNPIASMVDAARALAGHRFAILPLHRAIDGRCSCGNRECRSPGKHPRTADGLHSASRDASQIAEWWRRWPDANVGIATGPISRIFVIDVDVDVGIDGEAALRALEDQYGALPKTVTAKTGRGGRHIYFRWPPGGGIRNSAGRLGRGLDVRGEGGYVVAPPSIHESGRHYEWDKDGDPDSVVMADAPDWLLDLLRGEDSGAARPGTSIGPTIREGERNVSLMSLAGTMRRRGMSEDSIRDALRAENVAKCDPPLDETEVDAIAASAAKYPAATDQADAIDQLAALDPLAYDRARVEAAEKLGVRVTTLDAEVEKRRGAIMPEEAPAEIKPGTLLADLVPSDDPVDGPTLLNDLADSIADCVVASDAAIDAVALWVVFAHAHNAFQFSPRLAVSSPVPRCGKSTLLEWLTYVVPRSLPSSNASKATIFRSIEKWHPTLLIDEGDSFLFSDDELRGILNSGHKRSGAFVLRCVGEKLNIEPQPFSTWAPLVLSLIGRLPATLVDRSIEIALKRKMGREKTTPVRDQCDGLHRLGRQAARWARDNASVLGKAKPKAPPGLDDRARDNWRPLLAIADLAGRDWSERARTACLKLSASRDDETLAAELLRDLHALFDEQSKWSSTRIVAALIDREERPWAELARGKPLTPARLARMLKPFAIAPKQLWIEDRNERGYAVEQFADVFARYLPGQNARTLETAASRDISGHSKTLDTDDSSDSKRRGNPQRTAIPSGLAGPRGARREPSHGVSGYRYRDRGRAAWERRANQTGD